MQNIRSQEKTPRIKDISCLTVKNYCLGAVDAHAQYSNEKLYPSLTKKDILVLRFLQRFYWKERFSFSVEYIAKQCGVSKRSAERALAKLASLDILVKKQHRIYETNEYRFIRSVFTPAMRKEFFLEGKSQFNRALYIQNKNGGQYRSKDNINEYNYSDLQDRHSKWGLHSSPLDIQINLVLLEANFFANPPFHLTLTEPSASPLLTSLNGTENDYEEFARSINGQTDDGAIGSPEHIPQHSD